MEWRYLLIAGTVGLGVWVGDSCSSEIVLLESFEIYKDGTLHLHTDPESYNSKPYANPHSSTPNPRPQALDPTDCPPIDFSITLVSLGGTPSRSGSLHE